VDGEHDAQFVIDVFQTGSGTSTNMNANEVIGRLAGAHPNDDVNRGQSSNDVFPSAIYVAVAETAHADLLPAMETLRSALDQKAREFRDVLKIGRTHLQDAVPMRLGQEFSGYEHQVAAAARRIRAALEGIYELPLGGTAVGTGLNSPPAFAHRTIALLADWTGLPFHEAINHFEAQGARDAASFLSAALRNYAIALTKIANDIRLLASGPRCGLGELRLPAVQPGSSIMPGKVDSTIAWCCANGQLELNVMMPVMAYDLLDSIRLLAAASRNFGERCISGLEVDRQRASDLIERSLAMGTALVPEIGYERAAALAKEAYSTGRAIREVALEKSGIAPERLAELLDPARQAG
jgi:fumarate hydratase, class II